MLLRLAVFLLLLSTTLQAQGIDFFQGSWSDALEKAEAEDKLIFVDAYTDWCAPCKVMSAKIFPNEEVGQHFNANFISVKYDMEKESSADFRRHHTATAYPTLLFIDTNNEVVHRVIGSRNAKQLIQDATTALSRTDNLDKRRADYEAGKPEAAYRYVKALLRAGEPHLRIANEALRDPSLDFSAPATLRLLFIATTEADSRLYDLLLQHRPAIEQLEGDTAFYQQAHRAVMTTFGKALEYRSDDLMRIAADKMTLLDKAEGKRLETQGAFALALQNTDRKALVRATKNYLKRGAAGDEDRLRSLSNTLQNSDFIDYSEVIDLAVDAATAAAELSDEGWRDYYRLARFLQERKRLDQALQYAERSLTDLGEGPANYRRAIQALINELREATN